MKKPPNYDKMLFWYNTIKNNPRDTDLSTHDLAIILIVEFQQALERGIRHYHPVTFKLLESLDDVLDVLNEYGKVDIDLPDDDPNELLLKTNSKNDILNILWGKL